MQTSIQTSLIIPALGGLPLTASAQTGSIIYADDFAGTAGTPLNGTAPAIDNGGLGGMAGAAWAATSNLNHN